MFDTSIHELGTAAMTSALLNPSSRREITLLDSLLSNSLIRSKPVKPR